MDTHPWTGMASSKYDEDTNFTHSISTDINDPLSLLPQIVGAERVIVFPAMIPDISKVEIFHDDGTELMEVDVEVEIDYCEGINDSAYSYDE